jgi:hypothetical protein
MVTAQMVLELLRSCVGAKIATEVVAVAVAEVVVPDLVDVGSVDDFCDVNFAHVY